MQFNLKRELPLIVIILLPYLYLGFIWGDLPQTVLTHWNGAGEIDGWSNKSTLLFLPLLTSVLTYVLFLIIPYIDPKGQLKKMGSKYHSLKMFIVVLMTAITLYILYSTKQESLSNPNTLYFLIGLLFAVLGNYFKTIKHNYFIGIRTPWTLESETVWKKTHQLGGKLFLISGVVLILTSLLFSPQLNSTLVLVVTTVLVLTTVGYSYILFKQEQ
ncbi:SdpI family protein [Gangjinia marincola]|uniref:SdpI family protein n=1 Tax=Gangjinia marincola TaxID=578463 RepID=A0ABN1MJE7_9FLAO